MQIDSICNTFTVKPLIYDTQIPKSKRFSFCVAVVFAQSIEARCQVENGDVIRAVPTGDVPMTSEWSTILFLTKEHLILKVWQYFHPTSSPFH